MSYQLTGKIKEIFDTKEISEKFKVREFVVTIDADSQYPQHIKLQAVNNKCEQLSTFAVGNDVTIYFNLRGRESVKDGKSNYWNSLDAWKIESAGVTEGTQPNQVPQDQSPVDVSNNGEQQDDDLPF